IGAKVMFQDKSLTVVGVIRQARLYTLYEDGRPQILIRPSESTPYTPYFTVRTDRDPDSVMAEVRTTIHQIDPRIPLTPVRTMNDIVTDSIRQQRISAVLIAGFAVGALLLLLMGLFGLISSSVA